MRPPYTQAVGPISMQLKVETLSAIDEAGTRVFVLRRPLTVVSSISQAVDAWVAPGPAGRPNAVGLHFKVGWHDPQKGPEETINLELWAFAPGGRPARRRLNRIHNEPGFTAGTQSSFGDANYLFVPVPPGWKPAREELTIGAREVDGGRFRREANLLDPSLREDRRSSAGPASRFPFHPRSSAMEKRASG